MARVSLELLKKRLHVEEFEDRDDELTKCIGAAEQQILDAIGWTAEETAGIPDDAFPAPLAMAMLMRAATLFTQGEVSTQAVNNVPLATQALIKPYHRMRGGGLMERLVAIYPAGE